MITKSDLQAVLDDITAEERGKLPEPPTVEEMLAYRRGELSAPHEARVRELLVRFPELLRALATPLPDEPAPGDADSLSVDEIDRRWASLQKRLGTSGEGRLLQFWRAAGAIAAALAVVFGALFWHERSELNKPRAVWDQQDLVPDGGQRGIGDELVTLRAQGDSFLLSALLTNVPPADAYRLEIFDAAANPPRSLWSSDPLPLHPNDTFAILVRRDFLPPGRYRIVVYGVSGARQEPVGSYSLRVPAEKQRS
jgi:hypothetical protein